MFGVDEFAEAVMAEEATFVYVAIDAVDVSFGGVLPSEYGVAVFKDWGLVAIIHGNHQGVVVE